MTLLYSITMYYWPSLSPSISLSLSILQLHEPTLPFRNLMSCQSPMFLWMLFTSDLSTNKKRTKKIYLNVTSFYNHTLKCVQQALHEHICMCSNLVKSIKVCYYHLASESI